MFGFDFTPRKDLRKTIASRDYSIKIMKEQKASVDKQLHEETLKVVRLAAENATLKLRIIYLEGLLTPLVSSTMAEKEDRLPENMGWGENDITTMKRVLSEEEAKEKPPVHPKLLAYYNRGKKK